MANLIAIISGSILGAILIVVNINYLYHYTKRVGIKYLICYIISVIVFISLLVFLISVSIIWKDAIFWIFMVCGTILFFVIAIWED